MTALDPFGKREIYPTNTHPNHAKPWYLGIGNWKDRRYTFGSSDWEDYSISSENNTVILNFVNDPFIIHIGGIKGRFPVLALPEKGAGIVQPKNDHSVS